MESDVSILLACTFFVSHTPVSILMFTSFQRHFHQHSGMFQQQSAEDRRYETAQAMLAMDDTGALLRFVQRPNKVSLGEGEAALNATGRYSELVALYQERGQYEAALDLLRTLSLVCFGPSTGPCPGRSADPFCPCAACKCKHAHRTARLHIQ